MRLRIPTPGAVLELETPLGYLYGQYVMEHQAPPKFGSLVWVVDELHSVRATSGAQMISAGNELLVGFYPLTVWLSRGVATVTTGEAPIPGRFARMPTFRLTRLAPSDPPRLWDGTKTRVARKLSAQEFIRYPELVVYDELSLIQEALTRLGVSNENAVEDWYLRKWKAKHEGGVTPI